MNMFGTPKHPKAQTEKQKGMQELIDCLRAYDTILCGTPGLEAAYYQLLKENNIKRRKPSKEQLTCLNTLDTLLKG